MNIQTKLNVPFFCSLSLVVISKCIVEATDRYCADIPANMFDDRHAKQSTECCSFGLSIALAVLLSISLDEHQHCTHPYMKWCYTHTMAHSTLLQASIKYTRLFHLGIKCTAFVVLNCFMKRCFWCCWSFCCCCK